MGTSTRALVIPLLCAVWPPTVAASGQSDWQQLVRHGGPESHHAAK